MSDREGEVGPAYVVVHIQAVVKNQGAILSGADVGFVGEGILNEPKRLFAPVAHEGGGGEGPVAVVLEDGLADESGGGFAVALLLTGPADIFVEVVEVGDFQEGLVELGKGNEGRIKDF